MRCCSSSFLCKLKQKDSFLLSIMRCAAGGDRTCPGRDATPGDAPAGEEVAGDRAVPRHRQRQDGGAHRSAGRHDRPHHGRRVAAPGHPAADRRHEHAHGRVHPQQHPLHLPLLAGLLHQRLPAKGQGLHRLEKQLLESHSWREKKQLSILNANVVDGESLRVQLASETRCGFMFACVKL
jgi:hypothetical protein